jgi:hypothetical protein
MINWRIVLIGIIPTVMLYFIFVFAGFTSYIGDIVVGIGVGYVVSGGYRNGANHGAIVGAIAGTIFTIIEFIQVNPVYIQTIGNEVVVFVFLILFSIITDGIFGAIGGVIGASIKGSSSSKENTS